MVQQKYTRGENIAYDVDDWFIHQIKEIPMDHAFNIASQIVSQVKTLPEKREWSQVIAGVSHVGDEAFFFLLEYINEPNEMCVFLGVEQTDVDTYLDYIIENKVIKFNNGKE